MNSTESNEHSTSMPSRKKNPFGRRSAGGIAVVVLLAIYSFAQPKLNERFGWDLPGLSQNTRGQVVVDKSGSDPRSAQKPVTANRTQTSADSRQGDSTRSNSSPSNSSPSSQTPTTSASDNDDELLYGLLRETSPKRYISPAGLMYTPGSSEGHRLEHLRRHTKDDVSRPVHGVFDDGMEGALQAIDRAYERAKKNQKTTKEVEGNRTIYSVDMGGRVGFVGGKNGQRNRNPMARRIRLVLEGNRVITAFPL